MRPEGDAVSGGQRPRPSALLASVSASRFISRGTQDNLMSEPDRVSRGPRVQDAVLGRGDPPLSCRDRGSTPKSCSSAACGWRSRAAVRSLTSLVIWVAFTKAPRASIWRDRLGRAGRVGSRGLPPRARTGQRASLDGRTGRAGAAMRRAGRRGRSDRGRRRSADAAYVAECRAAAASSGADVHFLPTSARTTSPGRTPPRGSTRSRASG
jgi:hypothetical protein